MSLASTWPSNNVSFLRVITKVGRATSDAFGFVGGDNARVECLQQCFERWAVRVLGIIALPVRGFDAAEIRGDGGRTGRAAVTGRFFMQNILNIVGSHEDSLRKTIHNGNRFVSAVRKKPAKLTTEISSLQEGFVLVSFPLVFAVNSTERNLCHSIAVCARRPPSVASAMSSSASSAPNSSRNAASGRMATASRVCARRSRKCNSFTICDIRFTIRLFAVRHLNRKSAIVNRKFLWFVFKNSWPRPAWLRGARRNSSFWTAGSPSMAKLSASSERKLIRSTTR